MKNVIRCTRCIMDNSSDNTITFDKNGYCNYCSSALAIKEKNYFPNEEGREKLNTLLYELKKYGEGKKYDCIMGLSGGLDSSYLAYLGNKWGLRVLAIHVDDGFDTDISKENIRKLVNAAGIELVVLKPDPIQFNALTKAYMKSGVPNLAVPQDNVLFASLYDYARKNKIRYFLSGSNFSLESILQAGNTHDPYDVVNIYDIHKKYGEQPIDKLLFVSRIKRAFDERILKQKTVYPLNYVDYNKNRAFKELYDFCGFEYYGRKHLENILTAFAQLYWFPQKFGVDKRTSHLSSLIISEQMTRAEALTEYELPLCDDKMIADYIAVIKDKLNISDEEFAAIISSPSRQHTDYKTGNTFLFRILRKIYRIALRKTCLE